MEANEQKLKEVKGKMSLFKSDKMVFTPYGQGDPVYAEVKKVGGASLARTLGEKTQSLVARLKVDALAADPAAELRDQLEKVLKGLPDPQRKPRLRGRFLRNDADLKVRLDERAEILPAAVRRVGIVLSFLQVLFHVLIGVRQIDEAAEVIKAGP